jgi:hypothetical protein
LSIPALTSAVDDGHISFVVALAGGRREVVEPLNLLVVQLDTVGSSVFLDAGRIRRGYCLKQRFSIRVENVGECGC